jgi:hypothetical protein
MKKMFQLFSGLLVLTLGVFLGGFFIKGSTAQENEIALMGFLGSGSTFPTCLDNWESWESSSNPNYNAAWSLHDFPTYGLYPNGTFSQLTDINGDGLTDFIYAKRYNDYGRDDFQSCTLLNTGSGWDVAFRCFMRKEGLENKFYGDCAG